MAGELVLISGTTGFVGFRTLVYALKAGYKVRIAVRDDKKAATVANNAVIKALNLAPGTLTHVVVPSFTAPDAFTEAVKGVKFVLHLASPIPYGAPEGDNKAIFVDPAVEGTIGLLESVEKSGSVSKVVVTTSVLGQVPLEYLVAKTSDVTFDDTTRATIPADYSSNPFIGYSASKIASLNASEEWMKKQKRAFDLINIAPGYVFGRNDLATTVEALQEGTNGEILGIALGSKGEAGSKGGFAVHVDDVAKIHVESLNSNIAGNQLFVAGTPIFWSQVPKVIADHFPAAVKKGIVSAEGIQETRPMLFDTYKTERAFGKHLTFEDMVVSVVEQYIELKGKA